MKRKIVALLAACLLSVLAVPMISYADIVDAYWDGKEACWDDSDEDYTEQYQVVLYRGTTEVTRVKTKKTYYNFASDMRKAGTYRFRVRAYEDGEYNAWSAYSEEKRWIARTALPQAPLLPVWTTAKTVPLRPMPSPILPTGKAGI